MEFRHIQYFLKLAESSSISQAAGELYISQQALSKSIHNLEQELGVRLFHRSSQGIILTKDGKYLQEQFSGVCSAYEKAVRESCDHFRVDGGHMEFGVSPGFFRSIPIQYLMEFRDRHPALRVEHLEMLDRDCEAYVKADSRHFALSTKPWQMQGLRYIPLIQERIFFIAHRSHPLADRESVRLEELAHDRFLFFSDKYNIYHRTMYCCKAAGFEPQIAYRSSDVSQLIKMVSQKHGVFLCVKHVYEETSNEELVCIPVEDEPMYWELGVICQKREYLDQMSRLFIRELEENCNRI